MAKQGTQEPYVRSKVAVDAAVFCIDGGTLKVLLEERTTPPFSGLLELPGGLVRGGETAEEALERKLNELLGKQPLYFVQFATFTEPGRDPRERTISIGFLTLVPAERASSIPQNMHWHACKSLPQLAFDHAAIISRARSFLADNLSPRMISNLLPRLFPLNDLQSAYQLLENRIYDNRNFRKQMIASDTVEETQESERDVSHRPAKLYRFTRSALRET